jgi:hypothetical protein
VLLDEPTVGLDPQVRQELWALIDALRSEGTTILMSTHYIEEAERLADTVTIMSHGKAVAAGRPPSSSPSTPGTARRSRSTARRRGSPRSRPRRARGGAAHAPHRHERRDPRRETRRRRARGRAAPGEPRGRLRPAHRRGDRLMAVARPRRRRPPRAPRARRRARARGRQLLVVLALGDVLVDGRADDLPARVRLRLRLARQHVGGYDYVEFVGTGTVATAVLFSSAFPAMFGTFVKYEFQRTYDAILAAPVDTEELVTAEALWIAPRAGVYGCVPMLVGDGVRARPVVGDAARAVHRLRSPGFGWACFGIAGRRASPSRSRTSATSQRVLTPLFLVAGTFFPIDGCRSGRRSSAAQPALPLRPAQLGAQLQHGRGK